MTIYISAPFGNYMKYPLTTSVTGTWTLEPRSGLIKQIIKTLRYDFKTKSWFNSLGLRNPGVNKGIEKHKHGQIMSIAAIKRGDWKRLSKIIPREIPLELNISCPNISHPDQYLEGVEIFSEQSMSNPIVKLSPTDDNKIIDILFEMGFKKFHLVNTLKTNKGAQSGKVLQSYVIEKLNYIKKNYSRQIHVIAGGGITSIQDINLYKQHGAESFSLGTVNFNPWKTKQIIRDYTE
tara:strand:- start:211 stop:915 length:705 start_codon:yes stop_codon:yes gene_type:complete